MASSSMLRWSRPRPPQARGPVRRAHAIRSWAARSATPTMLEAGVSRNVTPPTATAVLDVRSTPDWTHEEIAAGAASRALDSEVVVTSTPAGALRDARRFRACSPPPARVRPGSERCSAARPAPTGCSSADLTRSRRARHQPPLAHARRVRGSARGHRGAPLLRRRWRATTSTGATGDRTHARGGWQADSGSTRLLDYTAG